MPLCHILQTKPECSLALVNNMVMFNMKQLEIIIMEILPLYTTNYYGGL